MLFVSNAYTSIAKIVSIEIFIDDVTFIISIKMSWFFHIWIGDVKFSNAHQRSPERIFLNFFFRARRSNASA